MDMKINGCNVFFLFVPPLFLFLGFGLVCSSSESSGVLGGIDNYSGNQNDAEIKSIGRFAVQEYNNKENALLEFKKIIKAKEQVVSGTLYYLTLEVVDTGKKKIYEAKVWVKPWMNFKKLEEFRHANDLTSFSSDDDAKKDAGH